MGDTKGALQTETQVQSPSSSFLLTRCVVWAGHFISLSHCVLTCEMSASDLIRTDIHDIQQLVGVWHWPIRTEAATHMVKPCSRGLAAGQPQEVIFAVPASPRYL